MTRSGSQFKHGTRIQSHKDPRASSIAFIPHSPKAPSDPSACARRMPVSAHDRRPIRRGLLSRPDADTLRGSSRGGDAFLRCAISTVRRSGLRYSLGDNFSDIGARHPWLLVASVGNMKRRLALPVGFLEHLSKESLKCKYCEASNARETTFSNTPEH